MKYILFNFRIWMTTPEPVQTKLVQVLATIVTDAPLVNYIYIIIFFFCKILRKFI